MLSDHNQYQGCKEQRALFRVLRIAIQETKIRVKPKEECSVGKKKSRGLINARATGCSRIMTDTDTRKDPPILKG